MLYVMLTPEYMFALSQKRLLKVTWWKRPSVTRAEERVTGGQ